MESIQGALFDGKECTGCREWKPTSEYHRKGTGLRSRCKACRAVEKSEYRDANSEKLKQSDARYYSENREKMLEWQKQYRREHPEIDRAKHRSWKDRNPEAIAAQNHRRWARMREVGGEWTAEEWKAIKESQDYRCLRCGRREPEIRLTADHVIPVSEGGPNIASNLQGLCKSCNSAKHRRPLDYRDNPAEPTLAGDVEPDTAQWIEETRDPGFIGRLRAGLKEHQMTGRQFAALCGCSPSNISVILCGRTGGSVPKHIWQRARDLDLFGVAAP